MKILIVENDKIIAESFREKLEAAKYEVQILNDGESLIPALAEHKPDLILLNLVLPQKSGFEVLEVIKKDAEQSHIPVIAVSDSGEEDDIKKALSLGAEDYFVKTKHPIEEIVEKVEQALAQKKI